MSTLTSKLIVSLVDQVTGPARAISATIGRLNSLQARNTAQLNEVRGRMFDAVAVGYALARSITAPVRAATEFETVLEDIGQKINAPVEALPKLGRELRQIGRDTTQSASAMAEGMDVLTGMGASADDALGLLPAIGRAATAYNADIADLSQAGYAALSNLQVPAENFGDALDAMAQAGKEGAFELKDMAQYFPALGAGYQALGQHGVPAVADLAAALQIVRKGTGDSATAATNLSNVLQKMRAPQTVAAFKKMGVNLEKELKKAAARGLTPIEAIAEITNKALKGDLSKLGYLFSDAQVQAGLRPLIQNIEEYRRIRDEAMHAQGVVEADYERRLVTGAKAAQRWSIALENLNLAVGSALLPALADLGDTMVPIINRLSDLAEKHPAVTKAIVATVAALVALRVAAIAAQFSFLWMRGGLITAAVLALRGLGAAAALAAFPLTALGFVGKTGAAGLLALLSPIRLVTAAMGVLRLAVIGTGIGAALVAIALAGAWIYENWTGISIAFEAFSGSFMRAIGPVMPTLQPVITGFSWLLDKVTALIGPIDAMGGGWARAGIAAGTFVGGLVVAMTELPAKISAGLTSAQAAVSGWFDAAWQNVAGFLNSVGALIDGNEQAWRNLGFTIGSAVGSAIASIGGIAAQSFAAIQSSVTSAVPLILQAIMQLGADMIAAIASIDLASAGRAMMQSLLDGIVAGGEAVISYIAGLGETIRNAITGAASGAYSGLKSGLGFGGDTAPAVDGAKAAGGPVRAGGTYLVGEDGPELVTFGQAGMVHDALKTARIMRTAALASGFALSALPAAAMPSMPTPPAKLGSPASARQSSGGPMEINVGGISIEIHAAPGQSPDDIAAAVERSLSTKLSALSRGSFSDGAN